MPCAIRTMYPRGEAQTATRPVGNCAGRRAERMMHTIAKASLHADSRIDMSWKSMKIDVKSRQNGSHFGPWCALGSFRGSKITQKLPKAPPKGSQGDLRAPFGSPRGVPRATKSPQRAPRGSPRALLGGLGRGKIEKKSVPGGKKVDFSKSAPRLCPADARSTLDPPKQLQNRPRMLQSGFLSRLGGLLLSLSVAQGRFGCPRRPPRTDSNPLRCLQRGFP